MYRIKVQYSKDGLTAYDLNGETLPVTREKAERFKSQGFYVEVTDSNGEKLKWDQKPFSKY